jgi:hypothetical protein
VGQLETGHRQPEAIGLQEQGGTMATDRIVTVAIEQGRRRAEEILAARNAARTRREAALQTNSRAVELKVQIATFAAAAGAVTTVRTAGFLVAAGDSWFDYPFHDVLKTLDDDYGYNVESSAHKGDPIEKMAYVGGQLDDFTRKLDKILAHGATPKAALLSGGGNDIAGNEFGMLLNSALSPIAGWDQQMITGVLNGRICTAYVQMLSSVDRICTERIGKKIPIVVHGYDYPVPDGRGFLGGWPFPGPWLEPGFREKSFADLQPRIDLMHDLMDRFNTMLATLPSYSDLAHVHYIDLRGTLSTGPDYQTWWDNELHPTKRGFQAVAEKFANVLSGLP